MTQTVVEPKAIRRPRLGESSKASGTREVDRISNHVERSRLRGHNDLARGAGKRDSLDAVLANTPYLWRGQQPNRRQATLATGHARLDRHLPGGGWPRGAVTELITARPGVGEFSLLFPALANASKQGRWLVMIDPPWVPYPATLHGHGLCLERLLLIRTASQDEAQWAYEQALRGIPEGIVLSWPDDIRFAALRRLQLAAESQVATAFLFRPEAAAAMSSPAALRLKLDNTTDGMRIEVIKCRGHTPAEPLLLRLSDPGWVSRAKRAAPEGSSDFPTVSSAAAFAGKIELPAEQGSETPKCSQRAPYERAPVAGDTASAPGAGLSNPCPTRTSRPSRHH